MKHPLNNSQISRCSVGGELGDSLGSFNNGVLGEFSWEDESDGSLDFSGWESLSFVVSDELSSFSWDFLEDIVDEWVHDAHWFLWDTGLLVNLLKYSEDVDWERFCSSLSSWGRLVGNTFDCLWGFTWFGWHFNLFYYYI